MMRRAAEARLKRGYASQEPAEVVRAAEALSAAEEAPFTRLCLKVPSMDAPEAKKAENLIGIFCGSLRVLFYDASQKRYVALANYGADPCPELIRELNALLGQDNVVLQRKTQSV